LITFSAAAVQAALSDYGLTALWTSTLQDWRTLYASYDAIRGALKTLASAALRYIAQLEQNSDLLNEDIVRKIFEPKIKSESLNTLSIGNESALGECVRTLSTACHTVRIGARRIYIPAAGASNHDESEQVLAAFAERW
jgi:hypothetical protein